MRNDFSQKQPFKVLGGKLKRSRVQRHESLDEVSGAVEIDSEILARIENGEQRPSEEILLLLISHFDISEDDSADLWELAGFSTEDNDSVSGTVFEVNDNMRQTAFVMPMDIRVVYTDMVHVMVNNYGVVMNFIQNSGPNNQPLAVARVGMSREHAKSVINILQQTLAQADGQAANKSLPSADTSVVKNKDKQ